MAVAAGAAAVVILPGFLAAQATTESGARSGRDSQTAGIAGDYLAARHASTGRDAASAAAFYRAALKADPRNKELLELAFYAELADGNIDEAVKLADRMVQIDRSARTANARLVLGVRALKQKQYQQARTQLTQAARPPVSDLIATLRAHDVLYDREGDAEYFQIYTHTVDDRFFFGDLYLFGKIWLPMTLSLDLAVFPKQPMSGLEFADLLERRHRCRYAEVRHVIVERFEIDLTRNRRVF